MYTDPSGYSVEEAGAYMGCTNSLVVAEAYYNAVIFNISMKLLSQVWVLKAVESTVYLSTDIIMGICVEESFLGTNNAQKLCKIPLGE